MAQSTPLFVGLDVHKDSIAVAHATGHINGQLQPRRLTTAPAAVGCKRLLAAHSSSGPPANQLFATSHDAFPIGPRLDGGKSKRLVWTLGVRLQD